MKRIKSLWYIWVILFVILVTNYKDQTIINWNPTFEKEDKIPYGTFLLHEQLSALFQDQEIDILNEPIIDWMDDELQNTNLLFIGNDIEFGEVAAEMLVSFAQNGNQVFIANNSIEPDFYETLGILETANFKWNQDTINTLQLVNPAFEGKNYIFNRLGANTYFNLANEDPDITVLGIDAKSQLPNFIRVRCGEGAIFLHLNPEIFTNIYLGESPEYISRCLSYLPLQPVLWDEYYKPFNKSDSDVFQVLDRNDALKYAWNILVWGALLALLFFAKRKQRPVPVILKPQNKSLEFLETIGDLYLNQADHIDMAKKKIRYFYHNVQLMYLLRENESDFWINLQQKSGVDESILNKLKEIILGLNEFKQVSPNFLLRLNNLLEEFYAQSGKYKRHE